MKLHLLTIMCGLIVSSVSYAQSSKTGNWFMYFGNNAISKKLNWWNEVQYRNYNFAGDLEQLMLRTGIGRNLTENNNNLLLGYGYILGKKYINEMDKQTTNEHRIFQQFITRQKFSRINIQHRYRVEERFLQNDFRVRFRYFLSLNIPINTKEMTDKTVYASAYNEIFLHANSPVFDRDRIYAALGYAFQKNLRLEFGFMTQVQEKTSRGQFQIALFNSIPYFKNRN